MADKAKQRIDALGKQLDHEIPAIKKVAGNSSGPRVQGKVIIITGAALPSPPKLPSS